MMIIFLSWSGERGKAVANALAGWLPQVINAIKPWVSTNSIDKGARWGPEISSTLEEARAGIVCLTPMSLHSDAILFEAGALSKTTKGTYVCTFLIDLEPSEVAWPLSQFQATKATKTEVLDLVKTLNKNLEANSRAESQLEDAFEVWWPKLESKLTNLPDDGFKAPKRDQREMIEELLQLVRGMKRSDVPLSDPNEIELILRSALKVAKSLFGPEVPSSCSSPKRAGNTYVFRMTIKPEGEPDLGCLIGVPSNLTVEEIEEFLRDQILRERLDTSVRRKKQQTEENSTLDPKDDGRKL